MGNQHHSLLSTLVLCAVCLRDYSTGNKVFGKFGSVRVFLDPSDVPLDNAWGRSWPEGIKLDDNFMSTVAPARNFQDGTLLSTIEQTPRRIAPVKRTYNWQAEELVISFKMTKSSNPSCSRLEPPVAWLATSGAKVQVLHSGEKTEEKTDSKGQKSASSVIEVSVSRNFAENSLCSLRTQGFLREDIYRLLDKGPWVLAFDISTALPRLFDSLQNDVGLTPIQAVHVVSHCPYLIAQYAHYKGRDVYATAKALLDAGYTLPKLIQEVMRFPSMLATPPDRIRGWMSLLVSFGVANEPRLFGKMLKRAPFMLYVNPPKILDEDLSLEECDGSTAGSGSVAYGALKVLQLLRAQNFPDLDKIVRTQPSILLVEAIEVSARANFLYNLFLENMSLSASNVRINEHENSIMKNEMNDVMSNEMKNKMKNEMRTPEYLSTSSSTSRSSSEKVVLHSDFLSGGKMGRSNMREPDNLRNSNGDSRFRENSDVSSQLEGRDFNLLSGKGGKGTGTEYVKRITTSQRVLSTITVRAEGSVLTETVEMTESSQETIEILSGTNVREESITKIEKIEKIEKVEIIELSRLSRRGDPREMLGALLLTYPAVLSIEHRQMRAAGNALRTAGLRRGEVLQIARRHPPVLGRDPTLLINLISFLRFTCGLYKADLFPFLHRYPAVLGAEVKDIEPKVDYLFQTLGGSQEMLRRFPSFLSFDLEAHTRPRAEFLRALKVDPLINGLAFLVNAPPEEIAYTAGVRVELFVQFQTAYSDMWKKKNLKEKEMAKSSVTSSNKDVKQKATQMLSWITDDASPEETFLDELDFSF